MKAPGTIPYYLQEQIRELIVTGDYRPGQPLREQELEKRFGSSRGPIREALRMLEVRGLVTHQQRRGFRVKVFSEREVRDLYLLRAELEAYAITQLAEVADLKPLLADLRAQHEQLTAAHARGKPRPYLAALLNFYRSIATFTCNVPLCEVLAKLNETAEPLRYNLLSQKIRTSVSPQYTQRIIDALARRDFAEAARLKREHVMLNLPHIIATYAAVRFPDASS